MKSGVARLAALLAVASLVPACDFTLTTDNNVGLPPAHEPDPFVLQLPLDGQTGAWPTNTQFAWTDCAGASSYTLELSRTSDFAQILHAESNLAIPSVFLTAALTHGTTYYWRVTALVGGSPVAAGGSPFHFTTLAPILGSPAQVFLQAPLGVTVGRTPTFLWNYSNGAVSYSLQIDTTDQFLAPVVDLPDLRLNRAVCPTILNPNAAYVWRVRAMNSSGSASCSPLYGTFTTTP